MASISQTSTNQSGPQMDMNPRAINVGAFAVARADEINTMMRSISTMGSVQRTFQKLPRHIQRRAMSHNIKRMPRRLRDIARIEIKFRAGWMSSMRYRCWSIDFRVCNGKEVEARVDWVGRSEGNDASQSLGEGIDGARAGRGDGQLGGRMKRGIQERRCGGEQRGRMMYRMERKRM
eukprot:XP_011664300.1 PREDICTED: uncharacterized protein LOC105438316 [Strongylocentrotus purpuratus]